MNGENGFQEKTMRENTTAGFFSTTMRMSLVMVFLMCGIAAYGQVQPDTGKKPQVKLIYGALTAANGPIWVAADQGLFEKYGLDVQVVHGRGATPVQATISGAVELGHYAGVQVVAANLSGSDLVFVAAQTNYAVLSIWTKRDSPVKSLAGPFGKTIGVGAPGSATHTNTRLALKKIAVTDKDVNTLITARCPRSLFRWTKDSWMPAWLRRHARVSTSWWISRHKEFLFCRVPSSCADRTCRPIGRQC
jgi:ABC-type nitrate/sulfonate/bicarbonate transport system substrate-binding protein